MIWGQVSTYDIGINCEEIYVSKRGVENLPRLLSMNICRHIFGYKLNEIASCISGIKPNLVSVNVQRIAKRSKKEPRLREQYYHFHELVEFKLRTSCTLS